MSLIGTSVLVNWGGVLEEKAKEKTTKGRKLSVQKTW